MNPTGSNGGYRRPPPPSGPGPGPGPGPPGGQQQQASNGGGIGNGMNGNNFAASGGFSFGTMPTPPPPGGIGAANMGINNAGAQQQQQMQGSNSGGMPFPFAMGLPAGGSGQQNYNSNDNSSHGNHAQQQQQQQQTAMFQQMQQNQLMLQMMQQAQQAAMAAADGGGGNNNMSGNNIPDAASMMGGGDPSSAAMMAQMGMHMGMMGMAGQHNNDASTSAAAGSTVPPLDLAAEAAAAMANAQAQAQAQAQVLPFGMPPMMMNGGFAGSDVQPSARQSTPGPPNHYQPQLQQIQPKPPTASQNMPSSSGNIINNNNSGGNSKKRSLVPLAPAPSDTTTFPPTADINTATKTSSTTAAASTLSSSSSQKKAKKASPSATSKPAAAAAAAPASSTSIGSNDNRKEKAGSMPEASEDTSAASAKTGNSDSNANDNSGDDDGISAFASLASPADEASAFHSSAAAGSSAAASNADGGGDATTSSVYSSAGASSGTTGGGLSISSNVQPSLPPEHAQRLLPPTLLGAGHTGFAGIGDAAKASGKGGKGSSGRVLLSAKEQLAAAAAAADAIVLAETAKSGGDGASIASGAESGPAKRGRRPGGSGQPLTAEEKAQLHRDRNREHARSTRLRKKAYVNKLKELVDTLRTERSEEAKRRRVAVQHLAEVQRVRRAVVNTFLKYHTTYESDRRKWATIVEEDGFVFKQPVTPYRYFRRSEIDKECRIASDIDSLINDGASMSVMIESIGSRSPRWMQIKREDFLTREEARTGGATSERRMPHSIVRQNSRLQHAVSSLSSSSGSSSGNGSGAEEDARRARAQLPRRGDSKSSNAAASSLSSSVIKAGGKKRQLPPTSTGAKKVSSSSSGGGSGSHDSQGSRNPSSSGQSSNDFHEYNAPDLPDPMLDTNSTGSDSPTGSGDDAALPGAKRPFSSNEEDTDTKPSAAKRCKASPSPTERDSSGSGGDTSGTKSQTSRTRLPPNIAKKGGISHDVKPMPFEGQDKPGTNPRLNSAPAIPLPPFTGLGKRSAMPVATTTVGAAIVNKTPSALGSSGGENNSGSGSGSSGNEADNENDTTGAPNGLSKVGISTDSGSAAGSTSSSSVTGGPAVRSYQGSAAATEAAVIGDNTSSSSQSGSQSPEITCTYHVNEDDMLLTDDVLMCPFVFRSRDAVVCGALAECVQPGMLRAQFSPRNKLVSFELVFDAMGFMQQLERASGSEGSAQIVPNSLEMALSPNTEEARVITMAEPPFMIVSVNEAWTRMTKYTQMEAEGKEMSMLNGKRTDPKAGARSGKPSHDFVEVAKGRSACSVNCHYDKHGGDFIDFVSSYPLTNADDKVTHLLHVCRKLPVPVRPGDIEFGSVTFRELDTTTSNTDNAALTQ